MQVSISKMFKILTRHVLQRTVYDMLQSSHDFEDVMTALNDRTDRSIELFRSCFTIQLANGNYFFTLCTLSFLVMAESIHIHYCRLSPAELKARAENMGYVNFAILFGVLDIGFVIVRVAGIAILSGSPAVATSLVLVSMSPSVILPMLTYPARLLKRKKHKSGGEVDMEAGTELMELRTEVS